MKKELSKSLTGERPLESIYLVSMNTSMNKNKTAKNIEFPVRNTRNTFTVNTAPMKRFGALLAVLLVASASFAGGALHCANDTVRVSAVGDVLIHQAPFRSVIGTQDGFYNLWSKIAGAFAAADISYANLEGPAALGITAGGQNRGDIGFTYDGAVYSGTNFVFNYHPRVISDLQRAGINVLSMANNHTMDRRSVGLDRTIDALRHYNMKYTGVKSSSENERKFWTVTSAKGMNIAWISCAEHLNGMSDSKNQVLKCAGSEILNQIRSLRQNASIDAIIVTPHWGQEYVHKPASGQRALAKSYVEAGASAIIGNHPHVLQSFEMMKSSDNRQVPVAYSLGNFISGQGSVAKNTSAVLYLDFRKTEGNTWTVTKVSALPTFRTPRPRYQVVPLAQMGSATDARNAEAWNIVHSTLRGVEILQPRDIAKCR